MTSREIRRGSVLVTDVVNFVGQAPRDLETISIVLDDFYTGVTQAVIPYQGEVVKWLGDGALICFWNEDSSLKAIRAALELRAMFRDFQRKHEFKDSGITVSISTGEMIAGTFGRAQAHHYDVFGEPVHCVAEIIPEGAGAITFCEKTYKDVATKVEAHPLVDHEYFGQIYRFEGLLEL